MGRILNAQSSNTSLLPENITGRVLGLRKLNPPKESLGSKVVEFGKDVAKDALGTLLIKPAQRTTEAITRTLAPESQAAKGYELQAQEGKGEDFNIPILGKYNVATVKPWEQGGKEQIAGEALKAAAYLAPYGKIAKGISATTLGASKLTPLALKTAKWAGELGAGAIGGGAFSAGGAMEAGLDTKDVLKQTALGVGLGVLAPVAFAGAGRLLRGKTKIPTSVETNVVEKIIPESISKTQSTIVSNIHPSVKTPEVQARIKRIVEQEQYQSESPLTFESTTATQRKERILSQTEQHIDNVLNGKEQPVQGTSYADYRVIAEDLASQQKDYQKLLDLGLSKTKVVKGSKAGQELGAFAQLDKNSVAGTISQIYEEKLGKLPGRIIKAQTTEVDSIAKNLRSLFNDLKKTVPSKEEVLSAVKSLDDLICP